MPEAQGPQTPQAGELVALADMTPDPGNLRRHPTRNLEAIKASLLRFGQVHPVVLDSKGIIRTGNGRYLAAKALGWTHLRAVRTDLAPVEAAAFSVADNRTAELAEWDVAGLQKVAAELDAGLRASLALEDEDLAALAKLEAEYDDQPGWKTEADSVMLDRLAVTVGEPQHVVTRGQIWQLGQSVLAVLDVVRDSAIWRKLLTGAKGELFLPYPGPLLPLCEQAKDRHLVLVQPSVFLAGHTLDQYDRVHGAGAAILVQDASA